MQGRGKRKTTAGTSLTASLRAPMGTVSPGDSIPFDFQLENMEKVATVVFTFVEETRIWSIKISREKAVSHLWASNGTVQRELQP